LNECVEAENWLREKKQQQDSLPKYANPVLLVAEIRKKAEAIDRYFCFNSFCVIFMGTLNITSKKRSKSGPIKLYLL
jgi:hypothetical protein